ncbi:MAG: 23S rRNA (guanosine(2251)-2'-O)-methyltransferase RlmB [Prevotellaceae bacterium]|jgi:23S rRNA (guanosine2251-2'-O)-methyltransferase|nr:23S rRNA (guanosine(2251)-2'-O)-methyltransferase RlmB [Prevotellaceae bacterium]
MDKTSQKNIIFGMRPVMETIKSGKQIEKLMLRQGLEGELFRELQNLLKQNNIQIQWVPVERLNRITKNMNHQGVVAWIANIEYANLEEVLDKVIEQGEKPFVLLLDGVTDVRNFGAIARSAECAGVHAIVIPAKGGAPLNADAMKTSAGTLNRIPVCRVPNLKTAIYVLKSLDVAIVGASEKADKNYFNVDLNRPAAIIMGSEGTGISRTNLELCDELIKIPLKGSIKSLNVSAAAAILLFETVKQRG